MTAFDQLWIWDDPATAESLGWYRAVAANRKPAKFRIAATIPVAPIPVEASEDELWDEFERLTPRFLERWQDIRAGAEPLGPPAPGESLLDLCHAAYERELPVFGSCWGHQVLARAFGGTVIYDSERAEFGCGDIELTEAGREDVLLRDFPKRFKANLGHHDRVTVLPPGAVELAFNESQRNQAFRFGETIYGTQFHSELDARRERERLEAYWHLYEKELGSDDAFQRVLDSLSDTTDADHLLYDFLVKLVADIGTPA